MGEWSYSFTILDFDTRWNLVLKFTPRKIYPRGKSLHYRFERRLGGPQSRSGHCRLRKSLPFPGIEPRSSSLQPVGIPTELSRLSNASTSAIKIFAVIMITVYRFIDFIVVITIVTISLSSLFIRQ
jgi:hypothetical protein